MSFIEKLKSITEGLDEEKRKALLAEEDDDKKKDVEESDDEDKDKKDIKESDKDGEESDDEESDKDGEESDDEESEEDEDEDVKEQVKDLATTRILESIGNYSFDTRSDILEGLCESQEFEQEFTKSVATIFESAVTEGVKAQVKTIAETAADIAVELVEDYTTKLEEDIDQYLACVVTEWTEENKVQLAHNARVELTESFLDGLQKLFEEHYFEVPAAKVDAYQAAVNLGEEYATKLHEAEEQIKELQGAIDNIVKTSLIESVVSGMPATKAERVRTIAESIQFKDEDEFMNTISMVAENVKGTKVPSNDFSITEDEGAVIESISEEVIGDPEVAAFAKALSLTAKF